VVNNHHFENIYIHNAGIILGPFLKGKYAQE